jgi:3-hydroxy-9,10-secoandrosta-1,3,5(10)-triene-9,17-dione monooxygenase reductase component
MALAASARADAKPRARAFRDALGRFPTGVAFVTALADGEPAGLIVSSLTSVSLEPPLVSFCPSRRSLTWSRMRRTQRFGVNVLGRRHERFARSASPPGADRFADVDWELGPGGVPLITDAVAALECDTVAEHPAGDHWIVVGRVHSIRMSPLDDPLVFFAGTIGGLSLPCNAHERWAFASTRSLRVASRMLNRVLQQRTGRRRLAYSSNQRTSRSVSKRRFSSALAAEG